MNGERQATPNEQAGFLNLPFGPVLPVHMLPDDVITCYEAAHAKRIPVSNELKSLILKTSKGLRAVHVRGDHHVSLKRVKAFLGCEEAYMLSPSQLEELGLNLGTVCPFLKPTWDLPHLVSRSVLSLEFVSTNSGVRNGYIRFSPRLLMHASDVQVGDFEAE